MEVRIEGKRVKFVMEEERQSFLSKMEGYRDRVMTMGNGKYYELRKGLHDACNKL